MSDPIPTTADSLISYGIPKELAKIKAACLHHEIPALITLIPQTTGTELTIAVAILGPLALHTLHGFISDYGLQGFPAIQRAKGTLYFKDKSALEGDVLVSGRIFQRLATIDLSRNGTLLATFEVHYGPSDGLQDKEAILVGPATWRVGKFVPGEYE